MKVTIVAIVVSVHVVVIGAIWIINMTPNDTNIESGTDGTEITNGSGTTDSDTNSGGTDSVPPPPENIKHTVVSGDNLSRIGQKYGVSYIEIAKFNQIEVNTPLRIGQVLLIPKKEN